MIPSQKVTVFSNDELEDRQTDIDVGSVNIATAKKNLNN